MPDRWVERPRTYPYRCMVSGKGDVESGPYYEFAIEYPEYPADDAPICRMYISAKYLRSPFHRDDAPYRLASEEELEQSELARQELQLRCEELEAELNLTTTALEHERDVFARARVKNAAPPRRGPRRAKEPAE